MTAPDTPPPPPPAAPEAVAAYREHVDEIRRRTVRRALRDTGDVAHLGDDAERMIDVGMQFTTSSLETAVAFDTVDLLADQLRWAMTRLPHDGVAPSHVLRHLEYLRDAAAEVLPDQHAPAVTAYVDWMIAYQRQLIAAGG